MTKIDIVSGFLGAGKTTLIKKLLGEALKGEQVVLIENEFGEIGVDSGFLKEAGIEIREMNSGCICCSLVGDFATSLNEVLDKYTPDRIIIEPSGVGKLSDVMKAVSDAMENRDVELGSAVAVVDASKAKMYIKNFGEFFVNQIEHAGTVILSRTGNISKEKLRECTELIREHNVKATIITTPWEQLKGQDILAEIEKAAELEAELMEEAKRAAAAHAHHHHHHDEEHEHCHHHGEECEHHHDEEHEHCHHHGEEHEHHHDEEHEHCHHHGEEHEHHHDEEHEHHHGEEHGHEHHHHHYDEDGVCSCGHHHHDADEVFDSWGKETPDKYTMQSIESALEAFESDDEKFGLVLRAKGMVESVDGDWIYFDYVPGEKNVRTGEPFVTGKICVIGSELNRGAIEELFAC